MIDEVQLDERWRAVLRGGVWLLQRKTDDGTYWETCGGPYKLKAGAISAYKRRLQKSSKFSKSS